MIDSLADKISDSELEVMKLLWQAEDALPVTEIREALQRSRGWEATTVKTLVSRLVSTEREYNAWATDSLIRRLYNGSAKDLVAALVHSEGLSAEDLDELRAMFRVED